MKEELPPAHSEFSPSGSGRWINCPGSIQAIRNMNIIDRPSVYAEEGTAAHKLGEMLLTDPALKARDMLGHVIHVGQKEWKVDEEMADAVEVYQEHILSLIPDFNSLHIEMRVALEHLYPGTFGTSDAVIVNEEAGVIIVGDYKHGRGVPVEAKENSQLMLYAIGVLMWLVEKGYDLSDFHTIDLHIIQPRCPHPEGPIRTWNTTVKELQAFSKKVKKAIINACSDDPYFEAGEKQCQWCSFAPKCKTLAEYSLSVAHREFKDFAVDETNLVPINSLTNEQIAAILYKTPVITHWIKSMVTYAQQELEKGHKFPDYKLVRGRANRIWGPDAETKLIHMIEEEEIEGFSKDDFYTTKFKTPAQSEQVLGRQKKDLIKDLIVKPEGKITIAHISDKRPSVTPTADAENEFSTLFEDDDG